MGRSLADAFITIRADVSQVAGDVANISTSKIRGKWLNVLRAAFGNLHPVEKAVADAVGNGIGAGVNALSNVPDFIRGAMSETVTWLDYMMENVVTGFHKGLRGAVLDGDIGNIDDLIGVAIGSGLSRGVEFLNQRGGLPGIFKSFTTAGITAVKKVGAALLSTIKYAAIAGVGLFTGLFVAPVTALVGAALSTAARGRDSQNFNFEFGEARQAAADFVNDFTSKMEMGIGRVNGMMIEFNRTFKDAFTIQRSESLSEEMVKLSADLAAFVGISKVESAELLNSALQGNADAASRLGIAMSDAAVEAQLLSMGVDIVSRSATKAEMMAARLALVYRDSASAAGASADGQNFLADVLGDLKDVSWDLLELFGDITRGALSELTAKLRSVASFARDNVSWFNSLGESIRRVAKNVISWFDSISSGGGAAAETVFKNIGDYVLAIAQNLEIVTQDWDTFFGIAKKYGEAAFEQIKASWQDMVNSMSDAMMIAFKTGGMVLEEIMATVFSNIGMSFENFVFGLGEKIAMSQMLWQKGYFSASKEDKQKIRQEVHDAMNKSRDKAREEFHEIFTGRDDNTRQELADRLDSIINRFREGDENSREQHEKANQAFAEAQQAFAEAEQSWNERRAKEQQNQKNRDQKQDQSSGQRDFNSIFDQIFGKMRERFEITFAEQEAMRERAMRFEFTEVSQLSRQIQERLGEKTEEQRRIERDKRKLDALNELKKNAEKQTIGVLATAAAIQGALGLGR